MSRTGKIPVVGSLINGILDSLLYIPKFYPVKDRSNSTLQVRYLKLSIKRGLCKGIVEHIKQPELPVVTSFYAPALAAKMAGHKNVFCIICDTDISRVWVSEDATASHIIYFASGTFSAQRLQSYGVHEKNIVLTGFPLPLELLGDRGLNTLKTNLLRRLKNIDPEGSFSNLYKHSVKAFLTEELIDANSSEFQKKSLTITYAVGGAGAQKEIGRLIVLSLINKIHERKVKINLVAGTRSELRDYFISIKKEFDVKGDKISIIWADNNESDFDLFNRSLQTTDILWTKTQ